MKRLIVLAALMMLMSSVLQAQAQTATPIPNLHLAPGFSKSGVLPKLGDSTTLGFDLPAGQDMVIQYTTDKVVLVTVCVELDGPPICPPGGGGGDGDWPMSATLYVPSSDRDQTIDVSILRPLEGAVNYRLETFAVTPLALSGTESRAVNTTTANAPYASYILNINPAQPFVISVEDANANGDFLWAAHQPYINPKFKVKDVRQTFPQRIDSAYRDDNPKGISSLELYYLGGTEFRVFVISNGAFGLNTALLNVQRLDAGVTVPLNISYRNPLGVIRLNVQAGDAVKVDFQITQGKKALVGVFREGSNIGDVLALGLDNAQGTPFPIAGTVHYAAGSDPLYAIVQLGDGSTREPFLVTMTWTPES